MLGQLKFEPIQSIDNSDNWIDWNVLAVYDLFLFILD